MDRIVHSTAVDIGGGRRGFRSKDTVAGQPGTVLTATHANAEQEELVGFIEATGQEPSGDHLNQLTIGVRSQALNYAIAAGSANALVVELDPVITAHIEGLPLRIKPIHTNTGPATLNEGAGARPIRRYDGTPLAGGEILAGIPFEVMDAGDEWVITSAIRYGIGSGLFVRSTPGAFSFEVPPGVFTLFVNLWGAGAGGGGVGSPSNGSAGGGGAGGRLFARAAVTPGQIINGVVGAGGSGGGAGGAGLAGGTTSFGGYGATGGSPGQPNSGSPDGGAGGSAYAGDLNIGGGAGGSGTPGVTAAIGGAGGGASSGGPGGSPGSGISGNGVFPGGGGGGRGTANSGAGSNGADGLIIVEW